MIRRQGVTALEVLFASALLAALFLPMYQLFQSSQHTAYLDEFQVLARRQAGQARAVLEGHDYATLLAMRTDTPPPKGLESRLSKEARELPIPLETGEDVVIEGLGPVAFEVLQTRLGGLTTRAFFTPLRRGFGRLDVVVQWVDPASKTGRYLVVPRWVEDPMDFEEAP